MSTEVNEFLNQYLGDPLEGYTKEQIMDAIQEYLIEKGYGKEKVTATILYVTNGGQGVDFSGYLDVGADSQFAAKLASLDVAKIYSYYATITTFATDLCSLYKNLYDPIDQYTN